MPTLNRLALTRENKGEPCLRLNYSGRPRGFERFTLDEQRDLNPDTCPCCAKQTDWTRIEHDVVGGKYLAYVTYQCDRCGWWNVFKYWEDREGEVIFAVNRLQPFLYDFSNRSAAVSAVLGLLKRDFGLLREIHWRVFEQLVQKFFSEQGFTVVDVSKYPTVGGDLLLISLDGKRILVEVKHLKYDPVGVGVVHKLRSVIQVGGYDAGLVVTSNRFSKDAIKLMDQTDEEYPVTGKDCADIAKWLNLIELRSAKEIKERLKQFADDDAMNEM